MTLKGILYELEFIALNYVASVRKRDISTERPPLFGEVSANFFG
jgi:hypothetical protein